MIRLRQSALAVTLLAALVLVMAAPTCAESRPELLQGVKVISNDAAASEFIDFYYLHPRPELTVSALQYFSRNKMLNREALLAPFSGFLSQVFRQNPKVAEQCARELTSPSQRKVLVYSIWMSQLDNAADLLAIVGNGADAETKAVVKQFTYQVPPDMLKVEIRSAGSIDALWGAYFATGDRRWVAKIVSVLPWSEAKDDQDRRVIGSSAQWSLETIAAKHKSVRDILDQEQKTAPEGQRRLIANVLREADKKTSTQ